MCDLSHNRTLQVVLGENGFRQRNDVSPADEFLTYHWEVNAKLGLAVTVEPFIKGIFVHFTE